MADADTDLSTDLDPSGHLGMAGAHLAAAQHHAGLGLEHVHAHPDFPAAPDDSGEKSDPNGGDGSGSTADPNVGAETNAFPGSAQSKRGFAANTGAARSYKAMGGR